MPSAKIARRPSDFRFNLLWFLPGYLVAVAIHTGFNQFPDRPLLAMMGAAIFAPIAIMAIFHFGTAEAQSWLDAESTEHRKQLEALQSGAWPEGPSGTRISALAGRLDPESAKRVRRYWELQAWLVMQAEEAMMEEAAGDATVDKAAGPLSPGRARRTPPGAWPEHVHRLEGAAPVQP